VCIHVFIHPPPFNSQTSEPIDITADATSGVQGGRAEIRERETATATTEGTAPEAYGGREAAYDPQGTADVRAEDMSSSAVHRVMEGARHD
jgi:hypothetical protein